MTRIHGRVSKEAIIEVRVRGDGDSDKCDGSWDGDKGIPEFICWRNK